MASRKEADRILATPAPRPWWNQHLTWTAADDEKLRVLVEVAADLDRSAVALGRSAEAIVWHAKKLGIAVPGEWAKADPEKRVTGKRRKPGAIAANIAKLPDLLQGGAKA